MQLDFYIPEKKIAFEVQGLQHYKAISFWGGQADFNQRVKRDKEKRILCHQQGVLLYEYDLRLGHKKHVMMEWLSEALGIEIPQRFDTLRAFLCLD